VQRRVNLGRAILFRRVNDKSDCDGDCDDDRLDLQRLVGCGAAEPIAASKRAIARIILVNDDCFVSLTVIGRRRYRDYKSV